MAQNYTLSWKVGNYGKDHTARIYLRISFGQEVKLGTPVRVLQHQWKKNKVVDHPEATRLNLILSNFKNEKESLIIKTLANGRRVTPDLFKMADNSLHAFALAHIDLNKGKFSGGRIRHLESAATLLEEFRPKARIEDVDLQFLQEFEKYARDGREQSTVRSKMNMVLSFLNAAARKGLADASKWSGYKRPADKPKIPVYLLETEVKALKKLLDGMPDNNTKIVGYYFLLSCYAGYRISDLETFDYEERIQGDLIVLRAGKNGEIISIPIYPALKQVLKYVKKHKFPMSQPKAREALTAVRKMAGIKKEIHFHSGRHTFAMYLLSKGLTLDEVAQLLGDSKEVAKVYGRIINTQLHKSVLDKLK